MYAVMISNSGLPNVVNQNSKDYPDMVMSGNYTQHTEGTQRECESVNEELIESFGQEQI